MNTYIIERKLSGSVRSTIVRGDLKQAMLNFVAERSREAFIDADRPRWAAVAREVRESTSAALESRKITAPGMSTISVVRAPSLGTWVMRSDTPPASSLASRVSRVQRSATRPQTPLTSPKWVPNEEVVRPTPAPRPRPQPKP